MLAQWNGEMKDISSSFVGVSPEFEMAAYTLLFLLGQVSEREIDAASELFICPRTRSRPLIVAVTAASAAAASLLASNVLVFFVKGMRS